MRGALSVRLWLRASLGIFCLLASCAPRGNRVVVGSKNFTEQDILGEIIAQQLERRTTLTVERKLHLGGTFVCHQALVAGKIDVYPEYTGTALVAILQQPPTADPDSAYGRVQLQYAARYHATWLAPFGFDNTFAMLVRGADARRLGIRTISDAARFAPTWRAGFGYEFADRADGWPGLAKLYGLKLAAAPRTMDLGLTYRALADSVVDLIAGNSTDGQIAALRLVQLVDDRRYFPSYQAAPVVGDAALGRHPEIRAALAELAGTIGDTTMQRLNYEVDVRHRGAAEVAREFLAGLGAGRAPAAPPPSTGAKGI
ncbi:MAG TPA: glycine betaine ABC transporter substrate-binding protein [Gemmatimonadales bacterium]|nr:glycine betaine ABC transporter substrate-binding protein [Gemmatimonadales bacterium]